MILLRSASLGLIGLAALASAGVADDRDEYLKASRAAWAARRAITHGRVVLSTDLKRLSPNRGEREDGFDRDISFSPTSIREDYHVKSTSPRQDTPTTRHIHCSGCEGNRNLIFAEGISGVQMADKSNGNMSSQVSNICDVRLIGYLLTDTVNYRPSSIQRESGVPESLPETAACATTRTTYDGHPHLLATLANHPRQGLTTSVAFRLDADHQPTSIRLNFTDNPTRYAEVKIRLKRYDGVWFPDQVSGTFQISPTDWTKETVTVKSATFGQVAAAGRFALAGLDLKPGAAVINQDNGKQGRWSGTAVNYGKVRFVERPADPPPPPAGGVRWWAVAAGVLLAAVGAAVFYRLFARR